MEEHFIVMELKNKFENHYSFFRNDKSKLNIIYLLNLKWGS